MYTNVNQRELEQLAADFYLLTNTLITVFDAQGVIICTYPGYLCDYCANVRKSAELTQKCMRDDQFGMQMCREKKKTYFYHCHMGLVEVVTPIIYNNVILGYVLFGQITDDPDKTALEENLKEVADRYRLDEQALRAALANVQYHSSEYIHTITRLLEMCANSIWHNSIISMRKEDVAFGISQYIHQHIEEELTVKRLCSHFNIGKSSLYEIAISNFGCGISEYIQRCRSEYAKQLLRSKEYSISQVAEMVGIHDVNYFCRFFKKLNNCTPKDYQKLHI